LDWGEPFLPDALGVSEEDDLRFASRFIQPVKGRFREWRSFDIAVSRVIRGVEKTGLHQGAEDQNVQRSNKGYQVATARLRVDGAATGQEQVGTNVPCGLAAASAEAILDVPKRPRRW